MTVFVNAGILITDTLTHMKTWMQLAANTVIVFTSGRKITKEHCDNNPKCNLRKAKVSYIEA